MGVGEMPSWRADPAAGVVSGGAVEVTRARSNGALAALRAFFERNP
jgi:hypothetical protein